ncbi:hypothetical protein A3H75_00065 [Candidatus Uhrbacteria bacterium RIFCSPLOWO2_02_FULL_51_9]|uniref:Uncharacterized protein n=1 Tax=Candidatus Uhrbacteria bacterium RIFCSPLOWO2_02_FULL_51_9 TaxID=1802410 RepID=A0A1F7VED7_9BACT|nr:MAG: hypothetical protein A3H75_00065 [Candidatus Uhrbacteria bacterium RIFCSPLOWO2_02_FULL_51_9]
MPTLEQFITALETSAPGGKQGIGLVVGGGAAEKQVTQVVENAGHKTVTLALTEDTETGIASALVTLATAATRGDWLIISLEMPFLDPALYNALRNVSDYGYLDFSLRPVTRYTGIIRPHPDFRVVVVTTQEILNGLNHPRFLDLCGPIVRFE